jgi:hypothetical protein
LFPAVGNCKRSVESIGTSEKNGQQRRFRISDAQNKARATSVNYLIEPALELIQKTVFDERTEKAVQEKD